MNSSLRVIWRTVFGFRLTSAMSTDFNGRNGYLIIIYWLASSLNQNNSMCTIGFFSVYFNKSEKLFIDLYIFYQLASKRFAHFNRCMQGPVQVTIFLTITYVAVRGVQNKNKCCGASWFVLSTVHGWLFWTEALMYSVYVVVNFLFQLIFVFLCFKFFSIHYHIQKQWKNKN